LYSKLNAAKVKIGIQGCKLLVSAHFINLVKLFLSSTFEIQILTTLELQAASIWQQHNGPICQYSPSVQNLKLSLKLYQRLRVQIFGEGSLEKLELFRCGYVYCYL